MKQTLQLLFKGLFFVLFLSNSLMAQVEPPIPLKLVAGGQKDGHVYAGLLLSIPKKWHVYAPSPTGVESEGLDFILTWEGSENIKDLNVLWPVPHKLMIDEKLSYVYEGKTLIPLEINPQNIQKPVTLNLTMSFLTCGTLCYPVDKKVSIVLKPTDQEDSVFKALEEREEAYEGLSLLGFLVLAFIGGLILNFMPCVLPVLSIKVMSLIKQSKKGHKRAKQGFFITGIGIIASFFLLALLTVVLKESGAAFGWGIHFQNPHFLLFVYLVLIAFSASLLGVFEIDLPGNMGTWLVDHEGEGRLKDFLSGVFATLLATPCSAPFVGTALSFALARNAADIFMIFIVLGLGFASPYFLISSLPERMVRLPKPGNWMMVMQIILGIGLALTAVWIGWIVSFHLPSWTLILSTALALLALSFFWIKHHYKPDLRAWLFAAPLFLIAWSLSWVLCPESGLLNFKKQTQVNDFWKPFDPDAIPDYIKQGKIVFVDVTAEWCITCAVNKRLVLNSNEIDALLKNDNVVAMQADWTKKHPRITKFLQDHRRYGIPFNIVFGPNHPEGIVLPEILTTGSVEHAFKEAGL